MIVLQARLFAYADTQRYRLGTNFAQLPINRPFYSFTPTLRDGASNTSNLGSTPNYIPSFNEPKVVKPAQVEQIAHDEWIGRVTNFETQVTDEDFVGPRKFWKELGKEEQKSLVENVAASLSAAIKEVRINAYCMLSLCIYVLGKS